jgi:hypothetical protein|tara:strand:+ start:968 stop:1087 length:120 start_codon:yes stop_codon:yes gene_type:complete
MRYIPIIIIALAAIALAIAGREPSVQTPKPEEEEHLGAC